MWFRYGKQRCKLVEIKIAKAAIMTIWSTNARESETNGANAMHILRWALNKFNR